ncbi:MAG: hypothetical protein IT223_00585 [Crocinitomicaceae bacterium]|nr:hypothetical protein [Crocinitomicaceae bacterium]
MEIILSVFQRRLPPADFLIEKSIRQERPQTSAGKRGVFFCTIHGFEQEY